MIRGLLLICCSSLLLAQGADPKTLLTESAAAWNRGDLAAFVSDYDDSPDTTFVGKDVTRGGVKAILERYQKGYPTAEKMGQLTFSELDIRPLADNSIVLMLGRFSLKRTAAGGGDAAGRFTLIWKKTAAGWKIIHDHSSSN